MKTNLPLPKYHQIYLVLREQIQEGKYAQGLPGELSLVEQFGVARVTIRRALQQLSLEGLVAREPGRGTRPALQKHATATQRTTVGERHRNSLPGLLENLVDMGLRTSVQVLQMQTVNASAEVAAALNLQSHDKVHKVVRVRSVREGPVSYITTYVPLGVTAIFTKRQLTQKPILLLLEEAGVQVGQAKQVISARLADSQVAQALDVAVGSALLCVNRVVYDIHDRPVQWLNGLYRPDRYEYQMQLTRVGDVHARVWISKDDASRLH